VVRGTTRDPARVAEIEAAGAEAVVGDPDRIATIARALDHVTVAYVLLGSATGPAGLVRALHETRLEMLLSKMLDTTIHGIVYEATGSVAPDVLSAGGALVRSVCEGSRIPYLLLDADPSDHAAWVRAAVAAADAVLLNT
jgi:H+/Cl- antiporter ClcA